MLGVIETATGRLQVALPTLGLRGLAVINQGIEAGQAGARSQEDGKKDERLSPTHAEKHSLGRFFCPAACLDSVSLRQ